MSSNGKSHSAIASSSNRCASASSSTSSPPSHTRQRIPYPATTAVMKPMNHMNNDCNASVSTTCSDEASEDQNAHLAKHDFMVSFMVDARGGSMLGCRYNGVKVIIPPKTVPQPMRITCRYVKQENLLYPPTLNEGEELASRILQVGPAGSQFLGPVLIEVPHVASLRRGERETSILRCDSASGGKWIEHKQCAITEKSLKESVTEAVIETMSSSMSSTSSSPSRAAAAQQRSDRSVCIVTSDFPQYFAIISRGKQEVVQVGASGAMLSPANMPRVKIHIPPKALTKDIDIGISAMHVEDEIVEEILVQGGAVSPIVTLEPRRRKFHKAITVTIPLPERQMQYNGQQRQQPRLGQASSAGSSRKTSMESLNRNVTGITSLSSTPAAGGAASNIDSMLPNAPIETTLKLVCSMSGNHNRACWEDVTDTTPLTFTSGGIQFTSVVSASFWAIDCPKWMSSDVMTLVDQLYKSAMRVPYLARFYLYARRYSVDEVTVRILCLTEPDRAENPLEIQEDFKELCRSDFVEIYDRTDVGIKFSGNLLQQSSSEQKLLMFRPFSENRQAFTLKRRNDKNPYPKGRVSFFTGVDKVLYEEKIDLTKFL